jgi:hypothetical protein
MMGSTSNALNKGGENFKSLYYDSDRNSKKCQRTDKEWLCMLLFVPMEWNMEGFIDRYGMPVFKKPEKAVIGSRWSVKYQNGAIDYWENEVDSLKERC